VNYLSHFVIDFKDGLHHYNAALIYPDITKKWIKKISSPQISNPSLSDFYSGSFQHYISDQKFHSSTFFKELNATINEHLKNVAFNLPLNRKWFISHILTELLIDRQLVILNRGWVDAFYEAHINVKLSALTSFLHEQNLNDTKGFLQFYGHFRDAQYIYYYTDNNKFLYSLSRIMQRGGIGSLTEVDNHILLDFILKMEKNYFSNPEHIYHALKKVFETT
jgi:hypothetical protein